MNIRINDSYNTWNIDIMYMDISEKCRIKYDTNHADVALNRSYFSMYIEWYLHNIGYWITLPFVKNEKIKALNERFKHVDLEDHR